MNITGGKYKGRKITAPDENITRPTLSKVRMGVFNILYSMIGEFEGKTFLDVFGGSGIMGLEALSRGFSEVKIFEKNIKAVKVIKQNYALIGIKPDIIIGDSLKLIEKTDKVFDIAYIDPPYESGIYEQIFAKLNGKAKILIAEHSEVIDIKDLELIKTKNYGGKSVSFYKSTLLK